MRMSTHRHILFLVAAGIFFSGQAAGQSPNRFELGFRQDFNSYLWRARLLYILPINSRQTLFVSETFDSDLLESSFAGDKWKDNHLLILNHRLRINNWLSTESIGQSRIFSDSQIGILNNTSTHFLGSGFSVLPVRKLEVKSILGWKSDRRFDRNASGLFYQVSSNSLPFHVQEYANQFSVSYQEDDFQDFRNRDFLLQYRLSREFYTNTVDSLDVRLGNRKITYFISETGDLESRLERETNISNWLSYHVSDRLQWKLFTRIHDNTSSVDQTVNKESSGRRERKDSSTEWNSDLIWDSNKLALRLGFIYRSKSQSFQSSEAVAPSPFIGSLGIPDNKSKMASTQSYLTWTPDDRDTIQARISISGLRYDTPDSNNFDDRDEFRSNFMLGYSRRLSPSLQVGIEAKGFLHHLVYLFAERSANNNWNRIIQLATTFGYKGPGSFSLFQRAEVRSNYTTFDFEDPQFQIKSFVFRKFTLTDSISVGRSSRRMFRIFHRLELEENGRLFWTDFSQLLLLNRRNHYLSVGVQTRLPAQFMLYCGMTGYLRREWRYRPGPDGNQLKERIGDFSSYGPQVRLYIRRSGTRNALISISRLRITDPSGQKHTVNQVNMNASWYF